LSIVLACALEFVHQEGIDGLDLTTEALISKDATLKIDLRRRLRSSKNGP
jgi:hypothetical protein